MGSIFKLVVLCVVLLIVAHYIAPRLPENPVSNWFVTAEKHAGKIINSDKFSDANTVKVSTWTDEKGVVHYENRSIEGAKTLEVDTSANVLPSPPAVKLPDAKDEKPKTMNDEVRELQKAKDAYNEAIINH